jgi:hypothetical protein
MHLSPELHLLQYQSSMAMALNTNLPGTSFLPNHELLVVLVTDPPVLHRAYWIDIILLVTISIPCQLSYPCR